MKTKYVISLTALVLALLSSPLLAEEGKVLYENNCTKCHTSEVFTREDRGIKSMEALMTRVKQCTGAAEVKWSEEEVEIVANYLNKDFYKF